MSKRLVTRSYPDRASVCLVVDKLPVQTGFGLLLGLCLITTSWVQYRSQVNILALSWPVGVLAGNRGACGWASKRQDCPLLAQPTNHGSHLSLSTRLISVGIKTASASLALGRQDVFRLPLLALFRNCSVG